MLFHFFGLKVEFDKGKLDLVLLSLLWHFSNLGVLLANVGLVETFSNVVSKHYFVYLLIGLAHGSTLNCDLSVSTAFLRFVCISLHLVLQFVDHFVEYPRVRIVWLVDIASECHSWRLIFIISIHAIISILIVGCSLIGLFGRKNVF